MHFLKYKLSTIFDEYIKLLYVKYCTNNIIFMNKTVNTRTFCKPAHTVTSIAPAISSSVYIFLHTSNLSMRKFLYWNISRKYIIFVWKIKKTNLVGPCCVIFNEFKDRFSYSVSRSVLARGTAYFLSCDIAVESGDIAFSSYSAWVFLCALKALGEGVKTTPRVNFGSGNDRELKFSKIIFLYNDFQKTKEKFKNFDHFLLMSAKFCQILLNL